LVKKIVAINAAKTSAIAPARLVSTCIIFSSLEF
jgi:hypothetical protein